MSNERTDATGTNSAPTTPFSHDDQVRRPATGASSDCPSNSLHTPFHDAAERQRLSPSPFHALGVSDRIEKQQTGFKSPFAAFRKPSTPASAHARGAPICNFIGSNARYVRAGTVDSRASSVTVPAAPSHHDASVASRTSDASARTGATQGRKRARELHVSGDEDEADYAPSEPESPLAKKVPKNTKDVPMIKKTKATDGSAVTSKPRAEAEKTKGKFGFKTATTLESQTKSSVAATPVKKSTSFTPATAGKPPASHVPA